MDVWFCVPPQESKTKAPGKELQKQTTPAPSERGTKTLAFPLTLLIMDVREGDLAPKWPLVAPGAQ
jgi:hypothetical protein